jgi:hypothetical protein
VSLGLADGDGDGLGDGDCDGVCDGFGLGVTDGPTVGVPPSGLDVLTWVDVGDVGFVAGSLADTVLDALGSTGCGC